MAEELLAQVLKLDDHSVTQLLTGVLSQKPELAYGVVEFAVPDLTFPPLKAITTHRSTGVIKSYNDKTQYGFIDCPSVRETFECDVFFPGNQMNWRVKDLSIGAQVSFAVFLNKDMKPQAFDLTPLEGASEPVPGIKADGFKKADSFKGKAGKALQYGSAVISGKGESWASYGQENLPAAWRIYGQESATSPWGSSGQEGFTTGKGCYGQKGVPVVWRSHGQEGAPAAKRQKGGDQVEMRSQGPAGQEEQLGEYTGTIKSFNQGTKGYGFIDCPDLKMQGYANDVFLHQEQLGATTLQVGDTCSFEVFLKNGRPQAKNLKPLEAIGW